MTDSPDVTEHLGVVLSPLLLVDDDDTFRTRLARALRERAIDVHVAANAEEAMQQASSSKPAAAVIDLRMPGESGLDLLQQLRAFDSKMRILVLTGYGSIATAVEAMRRGALSYLSKPADADEILRALRTGVGKMPGLPPPAPSLARAQWEHISRVLSDSGGNISEAARRLGIPRRTLQLKLKKDPPRS